MRSGYKGTKELRGRKIEAMHRFYGPDPEGRICGDCDHLIRSTPGNRSFFKCILYGQSSGESTDWRCRWQACMMINREKPEGWIPVIERLKYAKRPPEPQLEGQIGMEGIN